MYLCHLLLLLLSLGNHVCHAMPTNSSAIAGLASSILNITTSDGSRLLSQERPPDSFRVDPHFIPNAGVLGREDALLALVWCIGSLAQSPWNGQTTTVSCKRKPPIEIKMTAVVGTQFSHKEAIWSLARVLYWWVDQVQDWAETTWITGKERKVALFGIVKLERGRPAAPNLSIGSPNNNNGNTTGFDELDLSIVSANNMTISGLATSTSTADETTGLSNKDGKTVMIRMYHYKDRKTHHVPALYFYSLIIEALISFAEEDPTDHVSSGTFHDGEKELTLAWSPTATRAGRGGQFVVGYLIETMLQVCDHMAELPNDERFYEFRASVQTLGGSYIGRFAFYEGMVEPPVLSSDGPAGEDQGGVVSEV